MTYNPKQAKYTMQYAKKNLKRIPVDVQLSDYERIKTACDFLELPVNTFIKDCVFSRLTELEKAGIIPAKAETGETKPE